LLISKNIDTNCVIIFLSGFFVSIFSLFSHNLIKQKYVFFDFETTGLYPLNGDRIIEIALIKTVEGRITDTFESMINPGIKIPADATAANNITDEMIATAPIFDKNCSLKIMNFIEDGILVAHNAAFDLGFLSMEMARNGFVFDKWQAIDTLKIAREVFSGQRNNLASLMKRYNITPSGSLHRAIVDTEILKKIFFELIDENQIRELELDQIIKKYGFMGNNIPRNIQANIREAIIEKRAITAFYVDRSKHKQVLNIIPLAPVWNDDKWFLIYIAKI
jgi:DNA polymerase III epsilon subunit